MRTLTVTYIIANITATQPAELVCNSQVTDAIVITLGLVDTKGHHNRNVSISTIVV